MTFRLPICANSSGLIAAPGRGVLVSLCGKKGGSQGKTVANLLPGGRLVRHRVPLSEPGPVAVGPAGEIWAVRTLAKRPYPTRIYCIDPDGSLSSFSLEQVKESAMPFSQVVVRDLVVDGEGTVWAATADLTAYAYVYNSYGGDLVRIAPGDSVRTFPLPQGEPENLAIGPDGNIWFTAIDGRFSSEHSYTAGIGLVGRATPAGEFTVFPTPIAENEPQAIAAAPSGELWFAEPEVGRIGTIAVDGTFGREYRVRFGVLGSWENDGGQGGLAFDQEGAAWMPAARGGVGRLTPAGLQTHYPGPHEVRSVAIGREGNVWSLRRMEIRRTGPRPF
jgi:virginiamycin B lyase